MCRNNPDAKLVTQTFDPSLWSITVILSLAVIYRARLA
jgi:hypothetical protein